MRKILMCEECGYSREHYTDLKGLTEIPRRIFNRFGDTHYEDDGERPADYYCPTHHSKAVWADHPSIEDEGLPEGRTITIFLNGGLVQAVEGVPPGYVAYVRDYDVEGAEDHELMVDEDGYFFYGHVEEDSSS